MKKYTQIIALIIAVIVTAVSLVSCGMSVEIDEVKSVLYDFLPKAEELNVIYFGEGLPLASDRDVVEKFYSSFESDIEMINYHPVAADCGYKSEDEIREATLAVFTKEYSDYLFERAFTGITAVIDEGDGTSVKYNAIYAMYLMQSGILTVRIDLADEAIPLGREYDVEKAEIVRVRRNHVIVTVPSTLDGESLDVELKLVKTDDGWRLDSPTY